MNVRSRLALATAMALLALLLTFYVGGRFILANTFHQVEQEVIRSVPQLLGAVNGELRQVSQAAAVAATRPEVVEAVRSGQADAAARVFPSERLALDGLHLAALLDPTGGILSAVCRLTDSGPLKAPSASLQQHLSPDSPLVIFPATGRLTHSGMILLEEGPMLAAVHRIPAQSGSPQTGLLLLGRRMQDEEVIQRLSASLPGLQFGQRKRKVELRPIGKIDRITGRVGEVFQSRVEMNPWSEGGSGYVATLPIYDVYGRHSLSLVITLPGSFRILAEVAMAWLSFFVALVGILFIGPLLVMQGHAVLDPLTRLTSEIQALQGRDLSGRRLNWTRKDEFGVVARAVDGMLNAIELEQLQIEESEQRARALLEANPDLLFVCDRDGRILDAKVPPGAESSFAVPALEVVGRNLREVRRMPADVLQRLLDRVRTAIETGQVQTLEYHATLPDGQELWGECRIVRIDDDRAMAVERNMTDRHKAERGRRLLEVRIGQKQKMESLGMLASGIAHDFNNLLAAILGHAEEAAAHASGHAAVADAIGSIRSAVVRASGLTKQLQAYAGQGSFEFKPVNLNQMLNDMAHLMRSSLSKKANVEMKLDPALPTIDGDPSQLWQVAMNLLLNASDALDGKPGNIAISTFRTTAGTGDLTEFLSVKPLEAGVYAVLEVSDTGHGMTPETLARIFDPFFSTKAKGRGLGLSAVVGIVQAHGGGIAVRSTPGVGTQFRIALPTGSSTGDEAARVDSPVACPAASGILSAGQLVLVAEDDPDIRKVTVIALRSSGYEVIAAENGRIAVDLFVRRASEVCLVLLDVEMPEMNGEEAFRAIRAVRADVPIVVMTGYGDQSAQERFSVLHPSAILAKPFSRDQLIEVLGRTSAPPSARGAMPGPKIEPRSSQPSAQG